MSKKKFSEKELNKAIYKKALGYETNEVVEEYSFDENGGCTLNKRKVTKKHISPDLTAAKILLEKYSNQNVDEIKEMSDEEIIKRELEILQKLRKLKKKL